MLRPLLLALALLAGRLPLLAQESGLARVPDARLRLNATVEAKVAKHTKLAYTQSYRLKDNFGRFDASVQELTLTYGLTKHADLIARARLTYDSGKGGHFRQRYSVGGKYTYRAKPFDLSVRGLYQLDYSAYKPLAHTLRVQGRVQYDRKKQWAKPYFAAEAFLRVAPETGLYRMRYTAGSDFKLNKHHTLTAALLIQENWMGDPLYRNFMYTLGYEVKLPGKKKKAEKTAEKGAAAE